MRALILAGFWLSLVLLLGSFGGSLHGLGDSLAVFRHFWALSLSVASLLLLRGHFRIALMGILLVILGMAPVLAGYLQTGARQAGEFSIYQKNLLFKNRDTTGVVADILARLPDFVTLQEVSRPNQVVFEVLSETFRSSLFCPFTGVGGVAVLSSWPLVAGSGTCGGEQGLAAMQVETPAGPVWLVSVHLHWPFPHSQPQQLIRLLGEIEKLEGPVILGGDFNMVPWSHTMRQMERATGSQRAGRIVQSYAHETLPLRLPIDHILVPGGVGVMEVHPGLGSDHVGLLLRFDL